MFKTRLNVAVCTQHNYLKLQTRHNYTKILNVARKIGINKTHCTDYMEKHIQGEKQHSLWKVYTLLLKAIIKMTNLQSQCFVISKEKTDITCGWWNYMLGQWLMTLMVWVEK